MFDSGVGSTDLSLSSSLASASISQTPLPQSSSISASSPVMPSSTAQSSVAAASAPLPSAEQSSASAMLAKRERRLRLEKVGSYRVGRTLGRGNFAQVRIAYHEVANAKVAMKIVDKRSLDAENLAKIEREIQILQRLSHPFIVKLFEVIRTERCLYIVTEYVPNGELFDMLMDRGRQTEAESRRLFQQIVSAVAHCHANGIVHRDLKAENLLLDKKGNIKIIDFGFSNYQQPDQLLSTWCGSPPYAAPELLLAQEYDGRQSDVWSLGVILYILVTAGFPFPGDSVEKLKRAVLADHLKIPFWVSVECADLIRKMLTVSPVKRYTLQQVIQHRWMTSKMPDQIKRLLAESSNRRDGANANNQSPLANGRTPLDPTVLVFMQQQTGWSDDQITEEVLNRNYESPTFGTYELLLSRLSQFRDAEMASGSSIGAAMAVGGNLHLENEQTRRGSRGSIISGRANVEPAEAPICPTIPAHHLAKLSLSTSPDYQESEDSDSASDLLDAEDTAVSPRFSQSHPQPNAYKSRHRAYRRGRAEHQQQMEREQQVQQAQQRLPYALEYHQLNPLLNAAAQQFAVDTSRAWANAAAAAALFASQLQQQNSGSSGVGPTAAAAQQQFQQAAALNLVSLQNFPFVDYARMMHVPNQERRASANEALLGLNSYAHLLAACSTMGMGGGGGNGGGGGDTRCSSSQGTSSSPRQPTQQPHHRASYHQQPRRSVEEEGEFYLSQRGSSKRNTVHSITGGMTLLGSAGGAGTSTGGVNAAGGGAFQSTQSAFQRHKPYFKQGSTGPSGSSSVAAGGVECRSSWASSSAAVGSAALAINAQQQAQLERIYRQSIGQQTNAIASTGAPNQAADAAAAALSGVQQLQLEFQKLCASTKDNSPGPGGGINIATSASAAGLFLEPPSPAQQPQMPTINITDENNQKVGSAFVPPSTDSTSSITSQQPQIMSILAGTIQPQSATPDSGGVPQQANPFSQSLPHQRPATVCGFSAIPSGGNSSPSSPSEPQIKNLFIPVSLQTALERLQRFVQNHQLLCEIQSDEPNASIQTVNSVRIRVAPSATSNEPNATVNPAKTTTILELALHRMDQSPNISRATFQLIQGDLAEFDALKANLLATFNEVL